MVRKKFECECGRKMTGRSMRFYKGKHICSVCYAKKTKSHQVFEDEALTRTYEVKENDGKPYLSPGPTKCLIGRKFKLVEVEK